MQRWWLQPIVSSLEPLALFFGALGLTAITDNAALTYLGSLIAGISDESKYMLVAGAVAGGGLTVIANAPNPAGVALLKRGFADESIGAGGLLLGALGRPRSRRRRSCCCDRNLGLSRVGRPGLLSNCALDCALCPTELPCLRALEPKSTSLRPS